MCCGYDRRAVRSIEQRSRLEEADRSPRLPRDLPAERGGRGAPVPQGLAEQDQSRQDHHRLRFGNHGCQIGHKGDSATIYSKAFAGATKTKFAGVPSVSASPANSKTGAFSIKVKLSKKLKTGTYSIGGRRGGAKFGSATVKVTKASSSPPPQFY
jgi:hypothetical protein